MASAYTPYKLPNGKVVQIPNKEIATLSAQLKLSRAEAVDLWLFDNDYIGNEEEEALTAKAKENHITATIHKAKAEVKQKTQRERVVKPDPTKEGIIQAIAQMLPNEGAQDVVIANKSKLINFTMGGESFTLDLKRHRPPKEDKG